MARYAQVLAVAQMQAVGRAWAFGLLTAREVAVRVPAVDVELVEAVVQHAIDAMLVLPLADRDLQLELRHYLQMPKHLEGHTSHR